MSEEKKEQNEQEIEKVAEDVASAISGMVVEPAKTPETDAEDIDADTDTEPTEAESEETEASDAAETQDPETDRDDEDISEESEIEADADAESTESGAEERESEETEASDAAEAQDPETDRDDEDVSEESEIKPRKKHRRKKRRPDTEADETDEADAGRKKRTWKPGQLTPAAIAAIRDREPLDPEENERAKQRFLNIPAKLLSYGIIIIVVLVVTLILTFAIGHWKYRGYRVVNSRKQEDTLSAEYCAVEGNILRYSSDGASLSDRSGEILWDASYTMSDPDVALCGEVIAIYDKNGTGIVVCDKSGQIGTISTNLPIIKARVSATGNVAVIQEDSDNAWIDYYAKNGDEIASIKTSMNHPGYPLDVGVSRDGELVSVAYMSIADGVEKAIVHVYSFGSAGQNQMDNRIADFEYNGKIIPQVEYLSGSTMLAYSNDGFSIYEGARKPEEKASVLVEGEIASVFHDDTHIGVILAGNGGAGFRLQIYDLNGRQTLDKEFNFSYQNVDFVSDEVTLYNGADFCVFNLSGVNKFNGSYASSQQHIFALGKHRYVVVKETSLDMIQLQ